MLLGGRCMCKFCTSIAIFIIFLNSCTQFIWNKFSVKNYFYTEDFLSIEFSTEPDKNSCKKAISLKKDNESIEGRFEFNNKIVNFYPENGIQENYDWELVIDKNAESIDGVSLEKPFLAKFSTRIDIDELYLKSISPTDGSIVNEKLNNIKLLFSKCINKKSFFESFSIIPKIDYYIDFGEDGTEILIVPQENFPINEEYEIKISNTLMDNSRNYLNKEFESSFYYLIDEKTPDYSISIKDINNQTKIINDGAVLDNLCGTETLIWEFSEEVQETNFLDYIEYPQSLMLSYDFDVVKKNSVAINVSNFEYPKAYKIKFKCGVKDLFENESEKEMCIELIYNSQKIAPVSFIKGFIQIDDWEENEGILKINKENTFIFDELNNWTQLNLNGEYYSEHDKKNWALFVVFDSSKESSGVDIASVIQNLSISSTNGCCSVVLKKVEAIEIDKIEAYGIKELFDSVIKSDEYNNLSIFKISGTLSNSSEQGLLMISLSKYICDSLKNEMKDDALFVFNK